jgi:hypothetical protein
MMDASWVVGLEQTRPYEFVQLEIFAEQADAIEWATTYADEYGYLRLSKRRWRAAEDHKLIVWRRI